MTIKKNIPPIRVKGKEEHLIMIFI